MKRTYLLSLVSLLVFTIFIFLAIGTNCTEPIITPLEDGRTEERRAIYLPDGTFFWEKRVGERVWGGRWHGMVETYVDTRDHNIYLAERAYYQDGKRHGESIYYFEDGSIREVVCYEDGQRVKCPAESEQSAYILIEPTVPLKDYDSGRSPISSLTFTKNKISLFRSVIANKNRLHYLQGNAKARRSAYYDMIKRINPPNIQNKFDRGSSGLS